MRYDRPQERDHAYERDQRERSSLQNIKIVAGYVAVLALIALLVLFFIFYLYPHLKGEGEGPAVSESDTTASETQEMSSSVNETSEAGGPAEATTAAAEAETQPNAEGLSAGLEIKTLSHVVRFGGRTQGFAIIHNKNAEDVSITGQAKFLKGGATIGTDDGTLNIIGAGQTSILSFASEGEADELNVEIYAYGAPYHADALHMLRAEVKKEGQQAVVTVYNEGSLEAKYVYGHALFYQGGKLVASEGAYFDSGNSSLLPGEELSQEFDPHVDYDEVEFYMTARADKN